MRERERADQTTHLVELGTQCHLLVECCHHLMEQPDKLALLLPLPPPMSSPLPSPASHARPDRGQGDHPARRKTDKL